MKNKMRIQKILIGLLSVVIAVIVFGTFLGRTQTITVFKIKKDGIDLNKDVADQTDFWTTDTILKADADKMPGVVTNIAQLQHKKLIVMLKTGSPILLDALTDEDGGGSFAKTLPEYHTVHKIKDGPLLLPPGTSAGDLIDVAVSVEEKSGTQDPSLTTGMLLHNVKVYSMDKDYVYIQLTQQEALLLSNAEKYGTIILQLPGVMKTIQCTDVEKTAKKEALDYGKNLKKDHPEMTETKANDLATDFFNATKEKYNTSCLSDSDKGTSVTKQDVINIIKNNQISSVPAPTDNSATNSTDNSATKSTDNTKK